MEALWKFVLSMGLVYGFCINGVLCDEKRVFEEVIEAAHYNTKVRPVHNSTHAVHVELEFELRQITSLEQQQQVLHTSGYVVAEWEDEYISWNPENYNGTDELIIPPKYIWLPDVGIVNRWEDEYLTWNPDAYDGTNSIIIPPTNVWLPDIGVVNSADSFYHSTFTTDFRVHVSNTGHILWSFGGNFQTTCELDLTYFPFDRQVCKFIFENWAYNSYEVDLKPASDHVHLDDYHTNGEWELEHSSTSLEYIYHDIFPGKPFPKVTFSLYMRRKSGYYGLNIITPCFFIIAMSLVMFWLPADSGEKVSLGVTVLLAFSVFQLVIAESSPKTSDFFPILSLYVAFVMGMAAVSTVTSVLCLYFHHHLPNKPVPRAVKVFFFKYLSRLLCMYDSVPDMSATNWVTPNPSAEDKQSLARSRMSLKVEEVGVDKEEKKTAWESSEGEITAHLRYITGRMRVKDQEGELEEEWKALARVIDRMFFFLCLVVIATVCIYMFSRQEGQKH